MSNLVRLQLGKKGLTEEFISDLNKRFKEAESIRISLLKTATRNKEEMKQWAEKMINNLGKNYTYTLVGYTIVIRKWRKARK